MKKLKITSLLSALILVVSTTMSPVLAGSFGIGASIQAGAVDMSGTETLASTSLKTGKDRAQGFGSAAGYVQYMFGEDGFVLGYEKTPGKVELGEESVENKNDVASPDEAAKVTNTAKGHLSGHNALYIESPSLGGFFVKAAYNNVTLITEETLGTGSSYGNQDINGTTIGAGFRGTSESGIHMKLTGEVTNYDTINLTGVSGDGSGTENKIAIDADTYAIKFSLGYNF